MNPASKDIAQFLNGETALGLTLGTDLSYGRMNNSPEVCVTVLDNPGGAPMLTYDKNTSDYYYSSVCVQVRDVKYADGWSTMYDIVKFLHGLHSLNSIDNATNYALIRAMNDPQVLWWDEKDRVVFFVNFEVQRKPN